MSELETEFIHLMAEMKTAYDQVDLSYQIMDMVVERTGNYVEFFYSHRKLSDMARKNARGIFDRQTSITSPEELLDHLRESVKSMRELVKEIEEETKRLET